MDIKVVIGGPRRTPSQVFRAWVVGGGIAGAAITVVVLAIALALVVVPAVAAGAFVGSLIGAVAGVFRAALAMFSGR
jgi:hypothetical protein